MKKSQPITFNFMMHVAIIVAAVHIPGEEWMGIGFKGGIPWHLPKEIQHFKEITSLAPIGKQNAVIMGRKTWDSIPTKYKPLSRRLNIVLTHSKTDSIHDDVIVCTSIDDAFHIVESDTQIPVHHTFVIGGSTIYKQVLEHPSCTEVYWTKIMTPHVCDTFIPNIEDREDFVIDEEYPKYKLGVQEENGVAYMFTRFNR